MAINRQRRAAGRECSCAFPMANRKENRENSLTQTLDNLTFRDDHLLRYQSRLPRGQMGAMTVSFHRTDKLDAACLSTFERNLASDIRSVHKLPIGLELPLPQCILTAWYVRSVWRVRSNGLDICNQMRQAGRRHFGEMDLVTDPVS
jgi:hypothetical protein